MKLQNRITLRGSPISLCIVSVHKTAYPFWERRVKLRGEGIVSPFLHNRNERREKWQIRECFH